MKISMICFTENGRRIQERLAAGLREKGYQVVLFGMDRHTQKAGGGIYADHDADRDAGSLLKPVLKGTLSSWTGEQFQEADGIVFIGACGIAVRSIAPFIRDKRTDPAVVSIDETGRFTVPLLSGHLGGANALAKTAAEILGACPVITTATDLNRKFAVDLFAAENGLMIDDMKAAKEISADILAGEPVGFFSDFPISGAVPKGLHPDRICLRNIWITCSDSGKEGIGKNRLLRLIPQCAAVGIGCRRGMEREALRDRILEAFSENRVTPKSIWALSSIDLKSNEEGIRDLAKEWGIPFLTYEKDELERLSGEFTESDFVKETVGVGNVCERAAVRACMEKAESGRLLFPKQAKSGVTVAAAWFPPRIRFDGEESF